MSELITVIVPVYNVAEYLDDCVESIVNQSYNNLEIILVDDGSTDGSGKLCDEWEQKDSRIKVIHKPNGGVSSARNEGLRAAQGYNIGFIDGDDRIDPQMYEKLAEVITDADMACCGFVDYPMGTVDIPVMRGLKPIGVCDRVEAAIHIYERDGYFMSIWNKLYRRKAVERDGALILMDESLAWGEDEVWLAEVLSNVSKVAFVPEPLYIWQPRSNSVTRTEVLTEKHISLLETKDRAMKILPQEESVQNLYKAVYFNDCYFMKVMAYCADDWEKYGRISKALSRVWKPWLRSKDPLMARKVKVALLEAEMRLRLPKWIVQRTDSVKRYGVKGA